MKRVAQNTLLVLVSLGIALLVAEAAVRVVRPQNLSGTWRVETETGLMVNRSEGQARHQAGERVVTYSFGAPHLRGPRPDGETTVLVLGDSFTFGWLLADNDTYVHHLQTQLDADFGTERFALLNAAAGGWGLGDYVAFLEDHGEAVDPDGVLVLLNTDDIGRAMRSRLWALDDTDPGRLERTPVASRRSKRWVNRLPGYGWMLEHSHLLQLTRTATVRGRAMAPPDSAHLRRLAISGPTSRLRDTSHVHRARMVGAALVQRLQAWCDARDVPLIVSTTGWHQPPYTPSEPTRAFLMEAPALFADRGIPYADPSPALWAVRQHNPMAYVIPADVHPNEAGARLIAEHTYPFLRDQLQALCRPSGACVGLGLTPESPEDQPVAHEDERHDEQRQER